MLGWLGWLACLNLLALVGLLGLLGLLGLARLTVLAWHCLLSLSCLAWLGTIWRQSEGNLDVIGRQAGAMVPNRVPEATETKQVDFLP